MILEQRLLTQRSRHHAEQIASWVGRDRRRFRSLMSFFLAGDPLLAQKASWPVGICGDRYPDLLRPHLHRMLDRTRDPGMHDAVTRTVVRALQTVPIPPGLQGEVAMACFGYLSDGTAPIAIKCCAMTVLRKIAEGRPELQRELALVVRQQLPLSSAGFRARARQVLGSIGDEPGLASS